MLQSPLEDAWRAIEGMILKYVSKEPPSSDEWVMVESLIDHSDPTRIYPVLRALSVNSGDPDSVSLERLHWIVQNYDVKRKPVNKGSWVGSKYIPNEDATLPIWEAVDLDGQPVLNPNIFEALLRAEESGYKRTYRDLSGFSYMANESKFNILNHEDPEVRKIFLDKRRQLAKDWKESREWTTKDFADATACPIGEAVELHKALQDWQEAHPLEKRVRQLDDSPISEDLVRRIATKPPKFILGHEKTCPLSKSSSSKFVTGFHETYVTEATGPGLDLDQCNCSFIPKLGGYYKTPRDFREEIGQWVSTEFGATPDPDWTPGSREDPGDEPPTKLVVYRESQFGWVVDPDQDWDEDGPEIQIGHQDTEHSRFADYKLEGPTRPGRSSGHPGKMGPDGWLVGEGPTYRRRKQPVTTREQRRVIDTSEPLWNIESQRPVKSGKGPRRLGFPTGEDPGLDSDRVEKAREIVHKINQMRVYEDFFEPQAVEQTLLTLQGIRHHVDECGAENEDGNWVKSEPHENCKEELDEDGSPTGKYHKCPSDVTKRLWDTPWFKDIARIRREEEERAGEEFPGIDLTNLSDRLLVNSVRNRMNTLAVILDEFARKGAKTNFIVQKRHDRILKWWESMRPLEREFILGSLVDNTALYINSIFVAWEVGPQERESLYKNISDFEGGQSRGENNILGSWGSEQLYQWLTQESDIAMSGEMEVSSQQGDMANPPFPVMSLDSDGATFRARLQERVDRSQVAPKECDHCDGRGYGTKKSPKGMVVPDRSKPCMHCDTTGFLEEPVEEDHPDYLTAGQLKNMVAAHNAVWNAFKEMTPEATDKRHEEASESFARLQKEPSIDFNEMARQNGIPPGVLEWVIAQFSLIEDLDPKGRMKELHQAIFGPGRTLRSREDIMKSDVAQEILSHKLGMYEGQFRGGREPGKIVCAYPDGCGGTGEKQYAWGRSDPVKCLRCDGKGMVSAIKFAEASKEQENEITKDILDEYRVLQKKMTARFIQEAAKAGYTHQCNECFGDGEVISDKLNPRTGELRKVNCKECNGMGSVGDTSQLFHHMMEEMMRSNTAEVALSNIIKRFSRHITAARGRQHTETKRHLIAQFAAHGLLEDGKHILLFDPNLHVKGAPLDIDSLLHIRERAIKAAEGGRDEGKFFRIRKSIGLRLHNRLSYLDADSTHAFNYGDIVGETGYTKQDKDRYISGLLDLLAGETVRPLGSGFLREKLQNYLIPIMHPGIFDGLPSVNTCHECAGTTMAKDRHDDFIPYSICPRCRVEEKAGDGTITVRGRGYLGTHNDPGSIESPLDSLLFHGWNPSCAQCTQGMHSRVTQRGGYEKHTRKHASSFDLNVIPKLANLFQLREQRNKYIDWYDNDEKKNPVTLHKAFELDVKINEITEGEEGLISKELGRDFSEAMSRGLEGQKVLDNIKTIHETIESLHPKTGKKQRVEMPILMANIRCPYCEAQIEANTGMPPIPENWGDGGYGEDKRKFAKEVSDGWNRPCGVIIGGKPDLCSICVAEKKMGGCGTFRFPMLGDKDGIHTKSGNMPPTGCPNDDGISLTGKIGRDGKEMLRDIGRRATYRVHGEEFVDLLDKNNVQWPVIDELQKSFPGISKLTPEEVEKIKEKGGSVPDALKRKLGNRIRRIDYSPIPPFCVGDYVVHANERGRRIGSKRLEDYPMQDFPSYWLNTESDESGVRGKQGMDLVEPWSRGKEFLDRLTDKSRMYVPTSEWEQAELERLYAIHVLFPMHLGHLHRIKPSYEREYMETLGRDENEGRQKKARGVLGLNPNEEDIPHETQEMLERELEANLHRIAPFLVLEKQWELALETRRHMLSEDWPKSVFNLGAGKDFISGTESDSGEGLDKIVGELRVIYADAEYLLKHGYHSPDQHGFLPKSIRFPSMFLFRGNSHMSGDAAILWKNRDLSLSNPDSEVYKATKGKFATRKPDPEARDVFVPMTMEEMQPLASMIWRVGIGVPSGFEDSALFKRHQNYALLDKYPLEFPDEQPVWMQQLWFRIQDELLRAAHNPKKSAEAFKVVTKPRGRTHPAHLNGAGDGTICGVCDSTGEMFAAEFLRGLAYQKKHYRKDADGEQVLTEVLHGRDGEPLERDHSGNYPINQRSLEVLLDHSKPFIYGEWENAPGFDPDNLRTMLEHRLDCCGCDGTHICPGCGGDGLHRLTNWTRAKLNEGLEMLGQFSREMFGYKMNMPFEYRGQDPGEKIPPSLRIDDDSALWHSMDEGMLEKCGYRVGAFTEGYTPPFGTIFGEGPTGKRLEVTAPWSSRSGMGAIFREIKTPRIDLFGDHPPWGEQPEAWEALSGEDKKKIREAGGWPKEWRDGKVTEEKWGQLTVPEKEEGHSLSQHIRAAGHPGWDDSKHSLDLQYCEWANHCDEICPSGQRFCGEMEQEIDPDGNMRTTGYIAPNHQALMDSEIMEGFDGEGTPTGYFHGGARGIEKMLGAGFKYVGKKAYGWAPWAERELKKPIDKEEEERRAELHAAWSGVGEYHGTQRMWELEQVKQVFQDEWIAIRQKIGDEFLDYIKELNEKRQAKKYPLKQEKYNKLMRAAWDDRIGRLKEAREDVDKRFTEEARKFFHSLDRTHMWVPYFTHPHTGNIPYSPFDFDGVDELPPEPKHHNRMLHNLNFSNAQHKTSIPYTDPTTQKKITLRLTGVGRHAVCPNCRHQLPGDLGQEGSDNTCPLAEGGCGMVFDKDAIPSKDWTSRTGLERMYKPVDARKDLKERLERMVYPEEYADEGDIHGVDPALVICSTCHNTGKIRDPSGKKGLGDCPNCIFLPGIDPHLPGTDDTGSPTGGHYVTFANWDDALIQYHRPDFVIVKGDPEMMEAGGFRYISDADFPDVVEALSHGSGGRKPNPYLTATEKERKLIAKFKDKEGKPLDVSSSYLVKDTDKARRAHHYLMALLDGESGKRYGQDFKGLSFIPTLCAAFFSRREWRLAALS